MDAIVTAGGIPLPEDPLYSATRGNPKALVDVAGKPMVQWVLDALGKAKKVNNVVIVGLSERSELKCKKPTYYLPNEGHMLDNLLSGAEKVRELKPKTQYVLIVSSDIPGLTGEMVDWLVTEAEKSQDDLYYGVIPRDVMEERFPDSKRTWTHLKDMDVCGADICVSHMRLARDHAEIWDKLIGQRKSPLKQAAIIGYSTLFLAAIRRLTLEEAVTRASERIGIKGKAVVWPWAEAGMDVDKPHQLEIMREDLAQAKKKKK